MTAYRVNGSVTHFAQRHQSIFVRPSVSDGIQMVNRVIIARISVFASTAKAVRVIFTMLPDLIGFALSPLFRLLKSFGVHTGQIMQVV